MPPSDGYTAKDTAAPQHDSVGPAVDAAVRAAVAGGVRDSTDAAAVRAAIQDAVNAGVNATVAVTMHDMVLAHERRINSLDMWRAELRGALAFMKVAFGASILSAVASIAAIIALLSRVH